MMLDFKQVVTTSQKTKRVDVCFNYYRIPVVRFDVCFNYDRIVRFDFFRTFVLRILSFSPPSFKFYFFSLFYRSVNILSGLVGERKCTFISYPYPKMLRKSEICFTYKLVKPPMKVIDRTKAIIQHFLEKTY